jgi:hypothetical protein
LALATRRGLLITLVFFAWGAAHYFIAAAGFERSGAERANVRPG